MKLGLALPSLFAALVVLAACTTGDGDDGGAAAAGFTQAADAPPGRIETSIALPAGTAFATRSCTLTIRWSGGGNAVALAGEFTSPAWGDGALAMTPVAGGHEITLSPGPNLEPGRIYAYKFVVDSKWLLDTAAPYRKIVGGQMNSGLVLPSCNAGPELASDKVVVQGGDMSVRVAIRSAADGVAPVSVNASFDNGALPANSYSVQGDGSIAFSFHGLERGKHTLSLRSADDHGRASDPVDLPFWVEDEAFDYRDGILYMAMLDRFANGDRSNDRAIGAPVEYDADWHGGDLQGVLRVLESGYLEKLGVRTLWLSPLNTQTDKHEIGDGNQIFSAYHGYWPVKARQVDPRFGGDDALRAVVSAAHKRGIRVLLDLINNQVHEDHEYVSQNPSWFRHTCKCGDDANGCGWSQRPFDCQFQPYLPDIDWNQAAVEKQFIADAVSWISAFDLDGFRVDAVKHVEANSVYNMRAELSRRFEQGGARIFMVGETAVGEFDSGSFFGETFANGYEWIDAYTGPNALDGQFDFPTRHNMADGLANGDMPLDQVEAQVRKAETRYRPGNRHVRFLNGHDNPRIASVAAKDPKLGCLWTNGCRGPQLPPLAYTDPQVYVKMKRALTVLYTMPGVPYLYMGDEVAFGGGGDPDMRRNMIFEESLADVEMAPQGSSPAALTDAQRDLREWVRKLGATRTASHALRRGDRKTLLGSDGDLWVYAYQTAPSELAVVVVNRGAAVSGRAIDASAVDLHAITSLTSTLGPGSMDVSSGRLSVSIGAGEATVFVGP
jgi:glycosidase